MTLNGQFCGVPVRILVYGWHCQKMVRGLTANGLKLGRAQEQVDAVIVEALIFIYLGTGVRVLP